MTITNFWTKIAKCEFRKSFLYMFSNCANAPHRSWFIQLFIEFGKGIISAVFYNQFTLHHYAFSCFFYAN